MSSLIDEKKYKFWKFFPFNKILLRRKNRLLMLFLASFFFFPHQKQQNIFKINSLWLASIAVGSP